MTDNNNYRVLVAEKIADPGIELLERNFKVDVGTEWTHQQLTDRIKDYDAIVIRSATQVDAQVIANANKLVVIGRAGIGVDNVDVPAATKRGIIVANAPQSNIVAAAEHTVALMLALARRIPQAHASLSQGKWERAKFGGVEVYEKNLGILGFGRIGQLVAARAKSFGMHVIAFDPYVSSERFKELGVEQATTPEGLYREADFITLHLARTEETENWLNEDAFKQMKDGVRIINCARGELIDDQALKAAVDSGKVAGAALDVFRGEPTTNHPLFGYDNVVVTPHLGASTTEAQDRAGIQAAEQVATALLGGVVATAVNIPSIRPEDMEALGPFLPLCEKLGRLLMALSPGTSVDRLEVEYRGRIAGHDTRLLTIAAINGLLRGYTEEDVNYVNAPTIAAERGIRVAETKELVARDYADLVRMTVECGDERVRVVGTTLGHLHRPHLLEAWGQRFNLQLDDPYIALFRYTDLPGMMGRVGSVLGERGVNISAAAVGRLPAEAAETELAVMVVTSEDPIPATVVDEIVQTDGFISGRSVKLGDE